ncbi:MAG TPA: class A beta-lactamase [Actinocatenispora sp.]
MAALGLLAGCGGARARPGAAPSASAAPSHRTVDRAVRTSLAALERRYHARLGVFAIDTGSGRTAAYRADERFAHCSVSKALETGVLLRRDADAQLDQVVHYRRADLQDYSPVTAKHVATGMTVRQLIAAAMDYSDNTAANLLLDRLGAPAGLQSALRALGDGTTHTDRPEPDVNEATPGDVRDTSTPRALGTDLRGFALGGLLTRTRRAEYVDLLTKNTTGGPYVRAGVPKGWVVGDKTGSGGYGTRNDVAVVWPATGAPIVLAVLSDRGKQDAPSDDALIADATRTVVGAFR